jgi:homogentisate phytyltransferase / homogentisate geranylgeranyltransferase
LALWVLTFCYLSVIVVGVMDFTPINQVFLVVSHLVVLVVMWMRSLAVDLQDKTAITQFYQFIWKLFYLEYIMFPVACLLG